MSVEQKAPAWFLETVSGKSDLSPLRRSALAAAKSAGFPHYKNENWKWTNLEALRINDFSLAPAVDFDSVDFDTQALAKLNLPELDSYRFVFVNGRFTAGLSSTGNAEFSVHSLNSKDAVVSDHFGKYSSNAEHVFSSLNTGAFVDGLAFHIKAGKTVAKPIQIVSLVAGTAGIVAYPRILIVAEKNSQATIIEHHLALVDSSYLSVPVTEVLVSANARVEHYRLVNEQDQGHHMSSVYAKILEDGDFKTQVFNFGGALIRNEIYPVLAGEHAVCTMNGLSLGSETQQIDNSTEIDHAVPNCQSHELYKGIYNDKSKGIFSGTIVVRPDAQKTNAYQSNHSLLLSDTASSQSRPQLKIWADDVKCSHGATDGQLDDNALFYLRSRGIDKETARKMLIQAFAGELLMGITVPEIRTWVEKTLLIKLQ